MVCGVLQMNADKIVKLKFDGYSHDMASHLPAISGYRIVSGKKQNFRGFFKVAYIQMYLTDKYWITATLGSTFQLDKF